MEAVNIRIATYSPQEEKQKKIPLHLEYKEAVANKT